MKKILITGSNGFIGKNLLSHLLEQKKYQIFQYDVKNSDQDLTSALKIVDFVFHLAGVNRPESDDEFMTGNADLTLKIINNLKKQKRKIPVLLSSSIQADFDNPYGRSKRTAEKILIDYIQNGGAAFIFRLPNVFGKWCRPNYNSVVATFCHNIANDQKITITDRARSVEFVYIDDVVKSFSELLDQPEIKKGNKFKSYSVEPAYNITLGKLADQLYEFREIRNSFVIPDLAPSFVKKLYATYLSYLPEDQFSYKTIVHKDERGDLFELIKSKNFGQIFISKTKPGITRGNHYHHTKFEKFCVIRGEAEILLRNILSDKIIRYEVNGGKPEIIDIPPGYTHSIRNSGTNEMITLFWASEIFNKQIPDTYFKEVVNGKI